MRPFFFRRAGFDQSGAFFNLLYNLHKKLVEILCNLPIDFFP